MEQVVLGAMMLNSRFHGEIGPQKNERSIETVKGMLQDLLARVQ
jgi:hypothetical protein